MSECRPTMTDHRGVTYTLGDYVQLPPGSYKAGRDFFARTRIRHETRARIVGFDVKGFMLGHRNEAYRVALVLAVRNHDEELFVDPEDLPCLKVES